MNRAPLVLSGPVIGLLLNLPKRDLAKTLRKTKIYLLNSSLIL